MPVEKRTTPTVQKSIDFILTGIAEKRFEEEMILPTVADLARLAGVSKTKMVDAVGVLKSRGILSSTPGHRLRVKSDARRSTAPAIQPPAPPVGSAGPRTDLKLWQRIESRMKTDLLNGRFEDETPLPSHKDLQRTYDATYAVMRKALASLEEKGFIVSARRGYMPRPLPARTSLARIVFIIPGLPASGELYLFDNVDNVLFHAVETACANAGVRLDILAIPLTGDGAIGFMEVDTGKPLALTDTAETLGYLYSVEMAEVKHEDVLSRLRHFGKPVAVFSTLDDWTLPRILRQSPYFKLFTMTAPAQAAAQMARYLLRLGHRSIAYVSPHQRYAWSTARLEGLQSVYASAGH